ncbi:PAS domain-containing sensor histidine kinase [Candidatus Halobonum tyrrellensis]|uniref:histidine kinase n=1 Tax=Candidatus Halobonum tyrrellensis G22 TaxID=1324957 RepID=V4J1Z2_9EURY|nr:PAS domain-containing sensor histidine kinase [Candidatus Halobonum tyrrellensis]ESP89437.1 kinase-like protein [Candidatus Halobonum tyrrellensis G22]
MHPGERQHGGSGEVSSGGTESSEQAAHRRIVEAATGYAMFTLDLEGRIESWPGTAERLYGYEAADTVGSPVGLLWSEEDDALERAVANLAAREGDPVETEGWHERADGSVFWGACTFTPIVNGALHGYTVVTHDVTARKQYERMLERQNDRLEEFTDIVSHDLRSPLNVVVGRLDLYRETGDADHLDAVERSVSRMERLITDLLRVARRGNVVEHPAVTDIGALVADAREGALPDDATVEYVPVPPVVADADRLQQVFDNLFRNAVQHGGAGVRIEVGPLDDGFYVEDDGPGVAEADRSRVFDHGFTTDAEGGQGFGLSVVRTIVGAHGWEVAVTEASSGGARFEVTNVGFVE